MCLGWTLFHSVTSTTVKRTMLKNSIPLTPLLCTLMFPLLKLCLLFVGTVTYFLIHHHISIDIFWPIPRRFCQPHVVPLNTHSNMLSHCLPLRPSGSLGFNYGGPFFPADCLLLPTFIPCRSFYSSSSHFNQCLPLLLLPSGLLSKILSQLSFPDPFLLQVQSLLFNIHYVYVFI